MDPYTFPAVAQVKSEVLGDEYGQNFSGAQNHSIFQPDLQIKDEPVYSNDGDDVMYVNDTSTSTSYVIENVPDEYETEEAHPHQSYGNYEFQDEVVDDSNDLDYDLQEEEEEEQEAEKSSSSSKYKYLPDIEDEDEAASDPDSDYKPYKKDRNKTYTRTKKKNARCKNPGRNKKWQKIYFNNIECLICENSYKDIKDFVIHRDTDHSAPFKCKLCDVTATTYSNLRKHFMVLHKNHKPYKCRSCDKYFPYVSLRDIHEKGKHSKERAQQVMPEVTPEIQIKMKPVIKPVVKLVNTPKILIKSEMKLGIQPEIITDEKTALKTNFSSRVRTAEPIDPEHLKEIQRRKTECLICDSITFLTPEDLRQHVLSTHQDSESKCKICGKITANYKTLNRHYVNIHQQYKPFKCQYCDKAFAFDSVKKMHEEDTHLKTRPRKSYYVKKKKSPSEYHEMLTGYNMSTPNFPRISEFPQSFQQTSEFSRSFKQTFQHYPKNIPQVMHPQRMRPMIMPLQIMRPQIMRPQIMRPQIMPLHLMRPQIMRPQMKRPQMMPRKMPYAQMIPKTPQIIPRLIPENNETQNDLVSSSDNSLGAIDKIMKNSEISLEKINQEVVVNSAIEAISQHYTPRRARKEVRDRIIPLKECLVCEYNSEDKEGLREHTLMHSTENGLFCKYCTTKMASYTNLTRHYFTVHKNFRPYCCQYCNKSFSYGYNLTCHEREVHKNQFAFGAQKKKFKTTSYECPICDDIFKSRIPYNDHCRLKHYKEGNDVLYNCKNCGKQFASIFNLTRHYRVIHEKIRPFSCKICNKSFGFKMNLQQHDHEFHNDAQSSNFISDCVICDAKFSSEGDLRIHRQAHTVMKCKGCEKVSTNYHNLKRHYYKSHVDGEDAVGGQYECLMCDEEFNTGRKLRFHRISTHRDGFACKTCFKTFSSYSNLYSHFLVHHKKFNRFRCDICLEDFVCKGDLEKHMEEHGTENLENHNQIQNNSTAPPMVIIKCEPDTPEYFLQPEITIKEEPIDLEFNDDHHNAELKEDGDEEEAEPEEEEAEPEEEPENENQRSAVLGPKDYECLICDSVLKSFPDLKIHLETHTGNSQFQCKHCGIRTSTYNNLKRHNYIVHRQVRPFKCPYCPKRFPFSCDRRIHITDKHMRKNFNKNVTAKKWLRKDAENCECLVCGTTFPNREATRTHVLIHTEFVCRLCRTKTSNYNNLKRHHLLVHEVVHRYNCSYCPRGFTYDCFRKQHEKEKHHKPQLGENNIVKIPELLPPTLKPAHPPTVPATTMPLFKIESVESRATPPRLQPAPFAPVDCLICGKQFLCPKELKSHVEAHIEPNPFQCKLCPVLTSSYNNMKRHHVTIHKNVRPFKCTFCPKSFPYDCVRRLHIQEKHVKKDNLEVLEPPVKTEEQNETVAQNQKNDCLVCQEEFPTREALRSHTFIHEGAFNCRLCTVKPASYNSLKRHNLQQHEKPDRFSCRFCHLGFTYDYIRKQHENDKHKQRILNKLQLHSASGFAINETSREKISFFECLVCERTTFSSKEGLKFHVQKFHEGKNARGLKCAICGLSQPNYTDLSRHFFMVHQKVRVINNNKVSIHTVGHSTKRVKLEY